MPEKGLMHWRRTNSGDRHLYLKLPQATNWIHFSAYPVKANNPDNDMSPGWCVFQALLRQGWRLINDEEAAGQRRES